MDVDAKQFLDHFEQRDRSLIANLFLEGIRAGRKSAPVVVAYVFARAGERMRGQYADAHEVERMTLLQQMLSAPTSGATDYAQYCIDWEALPRSEREKIKQGRSQQYAAAAMQDKPATEKQLGYLSALGYTGPPPGNRLEASRLIDAWQAKTKTNAEVGLFSRE